MLSILRHPFRFQCFYLVYQAVILYHEIETSDFPPGFGLGDFNSKGNSLVFYFYAEKWCQWIFPPTPFIVEPFMIGSFYRIMLPASCESYS